jgi:hypothetical protein
MIACTATGLRWWRLGNDHWDCEKGKGFRGCAIILRSNKCIVANKFFENIALMILQITELNLTWKLKNLISFVQSVVALFQT